MRASLYPLALLLATPRAAWALPPCNQPGPCDPTIGPPALDPGEFEREARADPALQEQQRRAAWESVDRERRDRAQRVAEQRRRDDAPLRSPAIELGALTRARLVGKSQVQVGPALRLSVHWDHLYFIEVQGAATPVLMKGDGFSQWYAEPAFGVEDATGHTHLQAYVGLINGGRIAGGAPTFQIGPKVGVGGASRLIPLLEGYLGWTWHLEGGVIGGWGASEPANNQARGVLSMNVGLVVAL
jgi:hypothetical protein